MWVNDPAPMRYVADHLNVAKTAIYLHLTMGLCFSIQLSRSVARETK